MRISKTSRPYLFVLMSFALGISGCNDKGTEDDLHNQVFLPADQPSAGAVNLAVTFVAPWNDFVDVLSPGFTLTGDSAVNKVLPQTTVLEEKLLDALGVSAKLGLPTTSITRSSTLSDDTSSNVTTAQGVTSSDGTVSQTTNNEVTKETAPGTVPSNSGVTLPSRKAGDLPGLPTNGDKSLHHDPMLEYTAATALFQEVQLLNRYVQNAAQKHGYQPYIVRLQLGVVPYARNQPYDVYTSLSFFPEPSKPLRAYEDVNLDLNVYPPKLYGAYKKLAALIADNQKAFVVPLLVTDNLEGTLKSRSVDAIRQLSFALSFLVQGIAGEVGLEKLREDLQSVSGTDINGLLTVGQVSDNTIQVRLGAARQPSAGYAMIPRTHNISVLLMVPNDFARGGGFDPNVKVIGRTTMRHATNATVLPARSPSAELTEINQAVNSVLRMEVPLNSDKAGELIGHVLRNDFPAFRTKLRTLANNTPHSRSAWIAVTEVLLRGNMTGARFDLPRTPTPSFPDNSQTVLLLDNTTTSMTARLHGGAGLIPSQMAARLNLKLKESADPFPLYAKTIAVGSGGRHALMTFDSAAAWKLHKLDKSDSQLIGSSIELCMATAGVWRSHESKQESSLDCSFESVGTYTKILYRTQVPVREDPLFVIRQPLKTIQLASNSTEANVTLHIESNKKDKTPLVDSISFTIENAGVKAATVTRIVGGAATTGPAAADLGKYTIDADSTLNLTLTNLATGVTPTLKAFGLLAGEKKGGVPDPIVWTVK